MTTADLIKQKLQDIIREEQMESGGLTIGGRKKRAPSAYNKKMAKLLKQGYKMAEAAKILKGARGGMSEIDYETPEDAKLRELQEEYEIKKIELEAEKDYKIKEQQILERDPRYGAWHKLQKDQDDKKKMIKALKEKKIPAALERKMALEYRKKNLKFLDIPDMDYARPSLKDKKDIYDKDADDIIKLLGAGKRKPGRPKKK